MDIAKLDNLLGIRKGLFNVVRFVEERRRGDTNDMKRKNSNEVIQHLQLMDLPIMDRKYIWSSIWESPSLAKLDRTFVSPDWESQYPLASVQVCHRLTSDRIPLQLIGRNDPRQKKTVQI